MAIDWYRGEYEWKGGLLKAESARRGLAALAKGVEGAKDAYGRYREGGLRGVVDEEYAAEQKQARKEDPALRAELGDPEPAAPDHSQDPWYRKALDALGPKPQIPEAEHERLKGRVAQQDARTKRLRAISPLLPYRRDAGSIIEQVDPSYDFGPGGFTLDHPRGEPKPEKAANPEDAYTKGGLMGLAYRNAQQKAQQDGREQPRPDEVNAEYQQLLNKRGEIAAKWRPEAQPRPVAEWRDRLDKAHDYLVKTDPEHKEPTEQAVRDLANSWRLKTGADNSVPDFMKPTTPQAAAAPHGDADPAVSATRPDPDAGRGLDAPRVNPDQPPRHKDARVDPKEGGKNADPSTRRPGSQGDPHTASDDEFLYGTQPEPHAPLAGGDDEDDQDDDDMLAQ